MNELMLTLKEKQKNTMEKTLNRVTRLVELKKPVTTYNFLDIQLPKKHEDIVKSENKHKIIQGIRQSGKSAIIETIALIEAHEGNKTIVIVGNKLVSAIDILEGIKEECSKLGYLTSTTNRNDLIEFTNGSRIRAFGIGEHILRGMNVDVLLLDEFAFYDNNTLAKFWHANYTVLYNKKIIIASTRNSRSKKNLFWNLWLEAGEGKNQFKQFTIGSKDISHFTEEKLKEIKKSIGRRAYEAEYTLRQK